MKFGINITTFNRPEYAEIFFKSLSNSELIDDTIINITDDCSSDENTINLISKFKETNEKKIINIFKNDVNIGADANYKKSLSTFIDLDVDFIVNLDSDCILNKNWMIELQDLIYEFGENNLYSVFFCEKNIGNLSNTYTEVIGQKNQKTYYRRDSLNGLGLCFPKKILPDIVNNQTGIWFDSYVNLKLRFTYDLTPICTSVSYIQHIGEIGVNSAPNNYDHSQSFQE
jgi:glycosyltransferase involved in cell wall biosynthesis